ncbi:HEAT repeat domain-containing protein, partial [Patescibacteria group bacterium]
VKAIIIKILAKLNHEKIVKFILNLLKSEDIQIKANCIGACTHFDDINLIHYLYPYLNSENPDIKGNTIIALWKYSKYKIKLYQELKKMLLSTDKETKLKAIYVIGEVGAVQEKKRLRQYLYSDDKDQRLISAIALSKLSAKEGIPVICESLLYSSGKTRERIEYEIDILPENIKKKIAFYIRQNVCSYINQLFANSHVINLDELDKDTLLKLRNAYELVNDHEEVQNIDDRLQLQFNPTYNG